MAEIVIVGSGPSGAHFASTALQNGHRVVMLDVGNERPPVPNPGATFTDLKDELDDPVAYFLGEDVHHTLFPRPDALFYGFPASKAYVFAQPEPFRARASDMEPLFSFARGGLAEAWTGGVPVLNDHELAEFPFGYDALRPYYQEVVRRIGVNGTRDDLERFIGYDADYLPPLALDDHSADLLAEYRRQKRRLNRRLGFYMGLSRIATLTRDMSERKACSRLGRCFWGCPTESIYRTESTLRECERYPQFEYVGGHYVTHFEFGPDRRIRCLRGIRLADEKAFSREADLFVLAAGTMGSSKIFLDSWYRATGELRKLPGLMDTQTVVIPYFNPRRLGRPVDLASYQFHQLAIGIETERPEEYIHGQITTLKSAPIHPIVQNLPTDLRRATTVFRAMRSGLGVVNVWSADRRRDANYVTIRPLADSNHTELVVRYQTGIDEDAARTTRRIVQRALRMLGCIVPPAMTQILAKGHGIMYGGTLPMLRKPMGFCTTSDGRCNGFENLYAIDGVVYPFLPAKNMTLTLMANAVRVAEQIH